MQSQLPYEVVEKILYNMKAREISKYCVTNKEAIIVCNDAEFWKRYLEYNYDLKLLQEALSFEELPIQTTYINEIWNGLLDHSNQLSNTDNPYINVFIYLEASTMIKLLTKRLGIPYEIRYILFSSYDRLLKFIDPESGNGFLYGDDFLLYIGDDSELDITSLRGQPGVLDIVGNPSRHFTNVGNIYVKDVTINNIPIIDLMTHME